MKKILTNIIIFFLLSVSLSGCSKLTHAARPYEYEAPSLWGTFTQTYIHNGAAREYILYIPKDLPDNSPLVIGMHGYTSSPWTFKNNFGWDALAEQNKFIMCYPQGTSEVYHNYSHWNARIPLSIVDDVGFVSDLALYLADKYNLDKNRIFAVGFSNGGYMAYTLACERPDIFRAVASVSGMMSEYIWKSYNLYNLTPKEWLEYSPAAPIPICHIHGTDDAIVPIDGSKYLPEFAPAMSAKDTVEFWAGINGCTQKESLQVSENVMAEYYINPENNNQVWYYEYSGWGHFWPSVDYHVNKPSEINAQEIIWGFFSLYE